MSSVTGFLQLMAVVGVMIGFMVFVCLPDILFSLARDRRDAQERDLVQEAELERKLAIAEAAIAARKRGEAFVPPADYDR